MRAHQIIQTSCRRGIAGGGSGFQVYSCDEELVQSGILNSAEYRMLFAYDTPGEVGISSFGYAFLGERGSVFSLNTRLPHDFAGEGTRAGNLMNHSLLLDAGLPFYPAEAYGTPFLLPDLPEGQANSDEDPACLPMIEMSPSGEISIESIAEWLEARDGLEILERFVGAYATARSEDKTLVVFDDPSNVVRWVAALEYCLPLRAAEKINFVSYSENAVGGKAHIAGTTRKAFEVRTPEVLLASAIVFDPSDCDAHPVPQGSFIDFLEVGYSLNVSLIEDFASFLNQNVDLEEKWDTGVLDRAYSLYVLAQGDAGKWAPDIVDAGLEYALERGDFSLNRLLAHAMEQNMDSLSSLGGQTYMTVLKYLAAVWPKLDVEEQHFVERAIADGIIESLQDTEMDEADFQDAFGEVTEACSEVGLNIFGILVQGESGVQLTDSTRGLDAPKLRVFALSLIDFAAANEQSAKSLVMGSPLAVLYSGVLKNALAFSTAAGVGIAQASLPRSAHASLLLAENVTLASDCAIREAFVQMGKDGSIEEASAVDQVWDTCIQLMADLYGARVREVVEWLLEIAQLDVSRCARVSDLFDRMASRCQTLQEAEELYSLFCNEKILFDAGAIIPTYENIGSRYSKILGQYQDKEGDEARRRFLEKALQSPVKLGFVPDLVKSVFQSISFKRLAGSDRGLVDKAAKFVSQSLLPGGISEDDRRLLEAADRYEEETGGLALVGKAVFAWIACVLEEADRSGARRLAAINRLEFFSERLGGADLTQHERKDFCKLIAASIAHIVQSGNDVARIVEALKLSGSGIVVLAGDLYDEGLRLVRHGDFCCVVALNEYISRGCDREVADLAASSLARLKSSGDLPHICRETERAIRSSGDKAALRAWDRIYKSALDGANQGAARKAARKLKDSLLR